VVAEVAAEAADRARAARAAFDAAELSVELEAGSESEEAGLAAAPKGFADNRGFEARLRAEEAGGIVGVPSDGRREEALGVDD